MSARAWLVLAVAAGLLSGCGRGFHPDELPSQPIAFMRQEASKGLSGLDEFRDAMRIPNPDEPDTLRARRKTTLSLFDLKTRKVTELPGAAEGALPLDWSPDGSRLLLGRIAPGDQVMRLSQWNRLTGRHDIIRPDLSIGEAAIGPGPIRVAWIGRIPAGTGPPQVGLVLEVEQVGPIVPPDGAPGRNPDLAPDGRTVIFERPNRGLQRDGVILQVRLGGGAPRPLGRGSQPRFSQDGKWITFLRRREGQTDVWLMRADGSGKRALTKTTYDEEFPAVSPQGRYVVFASVRPPKEESQLYVVRVRDGREIQLTQAGQNSRPLW